jgi:hypothetical protein
MRRVAFGAVFALTVSAVGCSWFSGGGGTVVAAGAGAAAACVIGQVEQGVSDPNAIVAACAGVALDDVVSIVESLIAFYVSGDGGVPTAARMQQLQKLAASGHAKMGH